MSAGGAIMVISVFVCALSLFAFSSTVILWHREHMSSVRGEPQKPHPRAHLTGGAGASDGGRWR